MGEGIKFKIALGLMSAAAAVNHILTYHSLCQVVQQGLSDVLRLNLRLARLFSALLRALLQLLAIFHRGTTDPDM